MRRILLIRHGMTQGNLEHRYVGSTDEDLHPAGRRQILQMRAQYRRLCGEDAPILCVSPMQRAKQSAKLLFPGAPMHVIDEFAECRFGEFEYKNYEELNGNADYQRYIDSGGALAFPGGESKAEFTARVMRGYEKVLHALTDVPGNCYLQDDQNVQNNRNAENKKNRMPVIVAHGGTIMALLGSLSEPHGDYFTWQTKPGCGYAGILTAAGRISDIRRIVDG